LPPELILCRDSILDKPDEAAFVSREPVRIRVDRAQRRLDVEWGKVGKPPTWLPVIPPNIQRDDLELQSRPMTYDIITRRESLANSYVAQSHIPVDGLQGEIAVRANGYVWFFRDSLLADILRKISNGLAVGKRSGRRRAFLKIFSVISEFVTTTEKADALRALTPIYEEHKTDIGANLPKKQVVNAIQQITVAIFDPHAWSRRGEL
jgi:hypothetical protein